VWFVVFLLPTIACFAAVVLRSQGLNIPLVVLVLLGTLFLAAALLAVSQLRAFRRASAVGLVWRDALGRTQVTPWTFIMDLRAPTERPALAVWQIFLCDGTHVTLPRHWPHAEAIRTQIVEALAGVGYRASAPSLAAMDSLRIVARYNRFWCLALVVLFSVICLAPLVALALAVTSIALHNGDVRAMFAVALFLLPMFVSFGAWVLHEARAVYSQRNHLIVSTRECIERTDLDGCVRIPWATVTRVHTQHTQTVVENDIATVALAHHASGGYMVVADIRRRAPPTVVAQWDEEERARHRFAPITMPDGTRRHHVRTRSYRALLVMSAALLITSPLVAVFTWLLSMPAPLPDRGVMLMLGAPFAMLLLSRRFAIEVRAEGITWLGPLRQRSFTWNDIATVHLPSPMRDWLTIVLRDGTRWRCMPSLLADGDVFVAELRARVPYE
jgi:hypothetical protein